MLGFSIVRFESQKRVYYGELNLCFIWSYGFQILRIIQMKHQKDQYNIFSIIKVT